jgi:hypothetical protein
MRRLSFPFLALLLLASGCEDALGVLGGGCAAEMNSVRRSEGRGPDSRTGPDKFGGDYTEVWRYATNGRVDRSYTFRWGDSYSSCEVQGPTGFARFPAPAALP